MNEPHAVIKNMHLVAEYGRYDDLLVLVGTPCEMALMRFIETTLQEDMQALKRGEGVSLLAKWLPSVNTSNKDAVKMAKTGLSRKVCKFIPLTLSAA